jgi:hypothetical protein
MKTSITFLSIVCIFLTSCTTTTVPDKPILGKGTPCKIRTTIIITQ